MSDFEKIPKHIGVILDGNRRFAKKLMIKPWKGYEWGAGKVKDLLDWSAELGIKELTLYTFSIQNFNRPKLEFNYLMKLFCKEFDDLMQGEEFEKLKKNKIRVNFIGRIWKFPTEVQEKMNKLMEMTREYGDYVINFAMAYGGREEVIDAVKKVSEQVKSGKLSIDEINEEVFSQNMYLNSEPDLIIRTGGDKRTSNFLVWQSHYSEWFFLEKTWPEFEKQDFVQVIQEFGQRSRRFGR